VISSLNHPHICTLFDIGRQADVDYLVMEFLEGDTLARRLEKGALPLPELLESAVQIASALAAAHAAGIVHRDLKPGNVMLTKSGAKLLDFGLAKARSAEPAAGSAAPITTPGMLVGTVQYMSPEQIQGHEADTHSDLFAFGATLYEMLTGKRAFPGTSQFAIVNAILEKDPVSIRDLEPLTPPALERVVRRCLTKDPEKRWQNTSDLASELKWIAESAGKPATAEHGEVIAKGRRRERLYAAMAVIFLLAAVVSAVSYGRLARTPARVITAEITPPDKVRFSSATYDLDLALSPDGRALAFCTVDESGKAMLWIRSLDSPTAHPLPGTEGAAYPFWSADSRKLGFFAGSELKSIDAEGGPAVVAAGSSPTDAHGGSWNRDGTILFVPDRTKGVYQVAGSGGTPLPVIAADPRESRFFTHPRFLPDGKHFLYVSGSSVTASGGTYFASLDGREKRLLVGGNTFAMYASGFLLYLRENTLFAQAFDAERGRLKGDRLHRVAEQVARTGGFIHNSFDASENGTLVYRMKSGANEKRLEWLDRTGKHQGATGEPGDYWYVRLSPDGQKLASSVGVPNNEIWVEDLARAVRMRLTIEPGAYHTVPVWSPDGRRIVYAVQLGEIWKGIYQKYSNGAGSQELLLSSDSDTPIWPTSWSRDGRFILYSREARAAQQGSVEIWVLPLVGGHGPRRFIEAQPRAYDGQFSSNGRWVAYTSEESGRGEVYVVPFEAGSVLNTESRPARGREDRRWLVSANGGSSPRWRGDGKEIFYLSMANQMMAAEIEEKDKGIVVRTAQALFNCAPALLVREPEDAPYDVSPDGKKFVIRSFGYDNAPLILLVNWTANLK
jgi:Tol biopolymer transport system component